MTSEAEILVHITAPSTSKDDALYRTFATAYLNFDPGRTSHLSGEPRSVRPPPPPEVLLSPQASFQSVWDNVKPQAARPPSQQSGQNSSQHGKKSEDSWVQPPSEVADSMPHNDISIASFTTPTRIMKYFLQTAGPPSASSEEVEPRDIGDSTSVYAGHDDLNSLLFPGTESSFRGNDRVCTAQTVGQPNVLLASALGKSVSFQHNHEIKYGTPEDDRATSDSRMDESHVSQTPSSPLQWRGVPSPPKRPPGKLGARLSGLARRNQQSQSELHGITIPATQLLERAGSEPPPPKRMKTTFPHTKSPNLGRSSSDGLPRGLTKESAALPQTLAKDLAAPGVQSIDWSHETQLISVEPPPANHKLGPRVPVKLELLMTKFGMEGRYKPKFQARKLRDYERGYWLLNLDGWDQKGKIVTWGFLGNYIHKDGFAGWGTRACRDVDWKWLRLYGWEHIAGELYILLYVASYRRLKAMEITWYDGAGKELIVAGARSEKRILDWSDGMVGTEWH